MEHALLYCQVEYQEADAATGRTRVTQVCPKTTVVKRRSGVEIVSETPALRKAIKLQDLSHSYEVYFRFVAQGKIAFIRRDRARVCQYNLSHGKPSELADLVRFCIRLGVIAKSPLASLALQTPPKSEPTSRPPLNTHKRSASEAESDRNRLPTRRPLHDRSNRLALSQSQSQASPMRPHQKTPTKRRRLVGSSSRTTSPPPPPPLSLTRDQQRVVELIASKRNVFFTGSAGTGKSFLLQQILAPHGPLRGYLRGKRIFATATTGIAAFNIGGMTLHHFAGLDTRIDASDVAQALAHIKRKKDALQRWQSVDVLVVDEISMLNGRLFDTLEEIARELRPHARGAFFGGIQLVLSGDFYQLPPVATRPQQGGGVVTLCFESTAWQRGIRETVQLEQIFRQTNTEFVEILNALRVGHPTRAMIDKLNQQYYQQHSDDEDAICIFTHNNDVLETNTKKLEALPGRKFNYLSADTGRAEYLSGCPAPSSFSLKKNASVLLIKTINASTGLVNGCRGVVVGFTPQTQLPIVQFATGATEIVQQEDFPVRVADTVLASRRQLPLALAWAISIHKSQGLAFPAAILDLSRVFEFGQAYVALSRVRSLEGVRLRKKLDERRLVLANQRVVLFYQEVASRQP